MSPQPLSLNPTRKKSVGRWSASHTQLNFQFPFSVTNRSERVLSPACAASGDSYANQEPCIGIRFTAFTPASCHSSFCAPAVSAVAAASQHKRIFFIGYSVFKV